MAQGGESEVILEAMHGRPWQRSQNITPLLCLRERVKRGEEKKRGEESALQMDFRRKSTKG